MSTRRLTAIAAVIALVVIVGFLVRGGGDGGFGAGLQAPSGTTPSSTSGGAAGQAPAGCKGPRTATLERIAGKATDLIDFTPARAAAAPGGTSISAPVRPAIRGTPVATWLVTGSSVLPANAAARDQSSFPAKPVPASARPSLARSEACVRAGLPPSATP